MNSQEAGGEKASLVFAILRRMHWVLIALAIFAPLYICSYILNSIVPCAFFNVTNITIDKIEQNLTFDTAKNQCSFVMPSTVYRQLYEFGALATVCLVIAIAAAFFAIRWIVGSDARMGPWTRIGRWVLIVAGVVSVYGAQSLGLINPHSCISGKLIGLTIGQYPEDEICATSANVISIGSPSSSLKDIFELLYPLLVSVAALVAIALCDVIGVMIKQLRRKSDDSGNPVKPDDVTASAFKDVTFLMTLLSGLFTLCIALTNSYYAIGERALDAAIKAKAAAAAPAGTAPTAIAVAVSPEVAAYQDYAKAVALHWGAAGSATLALVFVCAIAIIAHWRQKSDVSGLVDTSKIGTMLFNLALIGLPAVISTAQATLKF
jgi:hypothetical protein